MKIRYGYSAGTSLLKVATVELLYPNTSVFQIPLNFEQTILRMMCELSIVLDRVDTEFSEHLVISYNLK